ncbi:hypothetical protein Tco_0552949 [Tanacetum coccineum]
MPSLNSVTLDCSLPRLLHSLLLTTSYLPYFIAILLGGVEVVSSREWRSRKWMGRGGEQSRVEESGRESGGWWPVVEPDVKGLGKGLPEGLKKTKDKSSKVGQVVSAGNNANLINSLDDSSSKEVEYFDEEQVVLWRPLLPPSI